MLENIKNNPVRIMAIVSAALALLVFYVPSIPVVLVLALVGAVLGVGEGVRSQVTPVRKTLPPPTGARQDPFGADFWSN